ncbi:MAG: hypothetical protein WCK93_06685 [Nitrosomonadales bacterium]
MSGNSFTSLNSNRSWGVSRGMPRSAVRQVEIPAEFVARRPTRLGLLIMARAKNVVFVGSGAVS